MEKLGIKPKKSKENALIELKRLTSSGHQVKEVRKNIILLSRSGKFILLN